MAQFTFRRTEVGTEHQLSIRVIDADGHPVVPEIQGGVKPWRVMSREFPDFESDDELVEWFESTDLSEYQLDEVLAWTVAKHAILTIEEPWVAKHSSGSVGATATHRT